MNLQRPMRVLLVEDDPGDQLLIREAIERDGVPVHCTIVNDGGDALDFLFRAEPYLDAPRPDLVLLDLNLTRVSGWDVLGRVRADDALRELPVVILSTSSWERDVRRAYRAGANSYVRKPAMLEDFERLGHLLREYWFRLSLLPSVD